jgi:membrane peptidoglycan carboxypeptidase
VAAKAANLGFNPKKKGLANGPAGSPWALGMAWTALANDGAPVSLELIDHMTNPEAKMVPLTPSASPPSLMKPAAASLLRYWLADARESEGLASAGHVMSDSFAGGMQGNLVAAIWVGPEKEGSTLGPVRADAALRALKAVLAGQPRTEMPVSNVEQGLIDRNTGQLSRGNDGLRAPFVTGSEPGPSTAPSRPQKKHR